VNWLLWDVTQRRLVELRTFRERGLGVDVNWLLWDVTQRRLVVRDRHFGITYRPHLESPESSTPPYVMSHENKDLNHTAAEP